jgi:hypothetical protein
MADSFLTQASGGFWEELNKLQFPEEGSVLLPITCDRFFEAKHFLSLAIGLGPSKENLEKANWYAGAYISATIAIRDGARVDFSRSGRHDFESSPLAREFYLTLDAEDPSVRDPVGINRAFRELRNLRVHFGISLVCVDTRLLEYDLANRRKDLPESGAPRWFLLSIEEPSAARLEKPHLSPKHRAIFNEWIRTRSLARVGAHHLWFLGLLIIETAKQWTPS